MSRGRDKRESACSRRWRHATPSWPALDGKAPQQESVSAKRIRIARAGLGLSQATAAARAGISRSAWTRFEAGEREVRSWDVAARMAAAVGLDLVVQLFPSELVLRDAPQVALLRDLRQLLGLGWSWQYEVRVGPAPDQRTWDAVAEHRITRVTVRVDAETRISDCQRILRRTRLKSDAGDKGPVVLAVRDTVHNRHALRGASDIITTEFPIPMRTAVRALRSGLDPGRRHDPRDQTWDSRSARIRLDRPASEGVWCPSGSVRWMDAFQVGRRRASSIGRCQTGT